MNTVQPCGSSTADQSESATSTSTGETEDDISSAVAPPIPKVQGLIDGRIEFLKTKEPQYWYEHQLILAFGVIPFVIGQTLQFTIYWANFSFEKKWTSYLAIIGVGSVTFFISTIIYDVVWTEYLGYFQPLPISLLVTGYTAFTAMICLTGYL